MGRYDDGHGYCFSCEYFEPSPKEPGETWDRPAEEVPSHSTGLLTGEIRSLPKRGLTEETCRRYGYLRNEQRSCQVAPYRDDTGRVVAQKLRFQDKAAGLPWVGDSKNPRLQLFGQHLQAKGRMLVVTEGEIDAMSVSQALGNKWPAVSIRRGAGSAKKDLLEQAGWLKGFDRVVLCFDADDAGTKAAEECARALAPLVPVHVATLPLKDASDMLQAGRDAELAKAVWEAPRWCPRGILRASDVRPLVGKQPVPGVPWFSPKMTAATYGLRPTEIAVWGAGVGCGKTEMMLSLQAADLLRGERIVIFASEQRPEEILRGLASKVAGRRFHVPDGGWTEDELDAALDIVEKANPFIYDRREDFTWPTIREHMRYLMDAEGVTSGYLDNVTACIAHADDDRKTLDGMFEEMSGLATSHRARLNVVSHLTTPEGKPHEEGGRVQAKQMTGSRAIARWASFIFGLERDTQAEDLKERNTVYWRCLKDRYTGGGGGVVVPLEFNQATGLLREATPAFTQITNEDF